MLQKMSLLGVDGEAQQVGTAGGDPLTVEVIQNEDQWLPLRGESLFIELGGLAFTTASVEGLLPGSNWVPAIGMDLAGLVVDLNVAAQALTIGADYQGLRVSTTGGGASSTLYVGMTASKPIDEQVVYPAPTVVSISPADGATNVAVGTVIVVVFSVPMDPNSLDWVLPGPIYLIPTDGAADPVMALFVSWSRDYTQARTTVTSGPLEAGKTYKVIVGAGGGSPLNIQGLQMVDAYSQAVGFVTAV